MAAKKCLFCGGKADLLCDSRLGWERKRGSMPDETNVAKLPSYSVPLKYRVIHTCDAPLCRACAVGGSVMHVRMKHTSFSDSIDYCPGHDYGDTRREITGLEAEAMRAAWRAKARAARGVVELASVQPDLFGAKP